MWTLKFSALQLSAPSLLIAITAEPIRAGSQPPKLLPHLSPDTHQGLEGGFWKIDGDSDSVLRLKNVLLNQPLDVTPSLFFADGTEYKLPVVHLEAAGVASVNIRAALQAAPRAIQSHISSFGMAAVDYRWSWPAVQATVQNIDEVSSITTHSAALANVPTVHRVPEDNAPRVVNGTWWIYAPSTDGFLALENASLNEKQVQIEFTDRLGKPFAKRQVTLAKHSTEMLRLSDMLGAQRLEKSAGGVVLRYAGAAHSVLAYSGLEDATIGYSASPHFVEAAAPGTEPVRSIVLDAPGVMLGVPDPQMLFPVGTAFTPFTVLHNVSAVSLSVSLSLTSDGSDGKAADRVLDQLTLASGESRQVDYSAYFNADQPMPNGFGNLSFKFEGHPGDLRAEAGSVDQSGSYVFEVTPSVENRSGSRTICYWSLEGDTDSMISVWNYKDAAQDLMLTLFYCGGQYRIPIHLAARQAYNLDMMTLVHSRVPDPDGALIPSNIASGSALLSNIHGDPAKMEVVSTSATYNVRNATCQPGCETCNGVTQVQVVPGSFTLQPNATAQATASEIYNTGASYPAGGTWSTGDSAVATVSSSGLITAAAPRQHRHRYHHHRRPSPRRSMRRSRGRRLPNSADEDWRRSRQRAGPDSDRHRDRSKRVDRR